MRLTQTCSLGRYAMARRTWLGAAMACGVALLSVPAYARHDPDHDRRGGGHRDVHRVVRRDVHRDWHGGRGYYGAPPVVYGSPYYEPPPVAYSPGVSFDAPGISINF